MVETGTRNDMAALGVAVPLFEIVVRKYLLKSTDPVTTMLPVATIPLKKICQKGVVDEARIVFE
jgi:hypothetical protein